MIRNRTPKGSPFPDSFECLLNCPLELQNKGRLIPKLRGRSAVEQFLAHNAEFRIGGKRLDSFCPTTRDSDPEGSWELLDSIFRPHRSCRLVLATNGYIGLVPVAAQCGGFVCILLGCNIPMILRQANYGHFEVIGGSYLQGFMEGKAVKKLHGRDEQLDFFGSPKKIEIVSRLEMSGNQHTCIIAPL